MADKRVDVAQSYRQGSHAGQALARKLGPWIILILALSGAAWSIGLIP